MNADKYKSTGLVLKRLLSFLKPYRFWVFVRIVSTVAKAAIDILVAYFLLLLVNSAVAGNRQELMKSIYFMLAFVAAGIIVYFAETYSSGRFSAKAARDIKENLADHIGKLPVSYMETTHSGDLTSKLANDVISIENYLKSGLPSILFHVFRFAASFIYMLFLNWRLLLFSMAVISAAILLSLLISRPLGKYFEKMYQSLARVNVVAQDCMWGIHIIKAFNLDAILFEKYKAAVDRTLADTLLIEKRNAMLSPITVIIQMVPTVLCFLYGGFLVVTGKFSCGSLVASTQMLLYLSQAASSIPGLISQYKGNLGVASHLFELMDQSTERTDGKHYAIDLTVPAIEFTDASFTYNGKKPILEHFSFKLSHGRTAAIVGPSGSGKTTIFKLLCGFYVPQGNCIKLYGKGYCRCRSQQANGSAHQGVFHPQHYDTGLVHSDSVNQLSVCKHCKENHGANKTQGLQAY